MASLCRMQLYTKMDWHDKEVSWSLSKDQHALENFTWKFTEMTFMQQSSIIACKKRFCFQVESSLTLWWQRHISLFWCRQMVTLEMGIVTPKGGVHMAEIAVAVTVWTRLKSLLKFEWKRQKPEVWIMTIVPCWAVFYTISLRDRFHLE